MEERCGASSPQTIVKVATALSFTDPQGQTAQVHFGDLVERVADLRTQQVGVSYEVDVALVEV